MLLQLPWKLCRWIRPPFEYYPNFSQLFPYKALNAGRSQSLFKADEIGNVIGAKNLSIYHDTTARKLEFLLGEALAHRATALLTFGAPGSWHSVEVAFWAHFFGIQPICMMRGAEEYPDRDAAHVRRILLRHLTHTSKLRFSPAPALNILATADEFLLTKLRTGSFPNIIPAGASNPLGFLGLINGIFDLRDRIREQGLPEPDIIVTRTGANAAGLLFGIKTCFKKSRLLALEMRYEEHPSKLFLHVKSRFPMINALFQHAIPDFPALDFTEQDFEVITGFGISDYVSEARDLQSRSAYFADKPLFYTRSWAALARYIRDNNSQDKSILVLDTYA